SNSAATTRPARGDWSFFVGSSVSSVRVIGRRICAPPRRASSATPLASSVAGLPRTTTRNGAPSFSLTTLKPIFVVSVKPRFKSIIVTPRIVGHVGPAHYHRSQPVIGKTDVTGRSGHNPKRSAGTAARPAKRHESRDDIV